MFAILRLTAVPTFVNAVLIPAVASFACCANEAKPFIPSLFNRSIALLKSSNETVPSFIASYRAIVFAVGPRSACAICPSCPGITSCSVLHDCRSTFPLPSICVYWIMAREASAPPFPPASSALLRASDNSVASPRDFVSGASCCVVDAMSSRRVGSPLMPSAMRDTEARASSAEYPRFAMTFGKLFRVSTRDTADPSCDAITVAAAANAATSVAAPAVATLEIVDAIDDAPDTTARVTPAIPAPTAPARPDIAGPIAGAIAENADGPRHPRARTPLPGQSVGWGR